MPGEWIDHAAASTTPTRAQTAPGEPPSSLSRDPYARPTSLRLIAYDGDHLIEHPCRDVAESARWRGRAGGEHGD
jgi:hypothetical protein